MGWPDEWVYKSAFGREWQKAMANREKNLRWICCPMNLEAERKKLAEELGRNPMKVNSSFI